MHHSCVAALDLEHLRELQLLQPRVREVERDRDAGDAVGREPLVGQPEMRAERQISRGQLGVKLVGPCRQLRALDADVELTELQIEQMFVGQRAELVGPNLPRHGPGHAGDDSSSLCFRDEGRGTKDQGQAPCFSSGSSRADRIRGFRRRRQQRYGQRPDCREATSTAKPPS